MTSRYVTRFSLAAAVVAAGLSAFLSGCAVAPSRPAVIDPGDDAAVRRYLDAHIRHALSEARVPGLSIALVDDQRVVWAQGYGDADVQAQAPATTDTVYRVGSISKLFTAFVAMQLVEQGQWQLDQPVAQVLPAFCPTMDAGQAPITVRQLMTHHAGLPRDHLKGFFDTQPDALAQVPALASAQPLAFAPGQHFHYSNLGMSVLGAGLASVTGDDFAVLLQRAVLAPLGMRSAQFEQGSSRSAAMAKSYKADGSADPDWLIRDVPAGGLNASANDLARFMSMVFAQGRAADGQRLLSAAGVAQMLQPQFAARAAPEQAVGLAWMLGTSVGQPDLPGERLVQHGGALGGFRSALMLLPDRKLGVVVLANSVRAQSLVSRVAVEALAIALEARTGRRVPTAAVEPVAPVALPANVADNWAGDYGTVFGLLRVRRDGAALRASLGDQQLQLRWGADGQMHARYLLWGLLPLSVAALETTGLTRLAVDDDDLLVAQQDGRRMVIGRRVRPSALPQVLPAWRARLGDYEIANQGRDPVDMDLIRLQEVDGLFVIDLRERGESGVLRQVIMPVSATEARLVGPTPQGGEVVRALRTDGQDGLAYAGFVARRRTPR